MSALSKIRERWPEPDHRADVHARILTPLDAPHIARFCRENRSEFRHLSRPDSQFEESCDEYQGVAFYKDPRDLSSVLAALCWRRYDVVSSDSVHRVKEAASRTVSCLFGGTVRRDQDPSLLWDLTVIGRVYLEAASSFRGDPCQSFFGFYDDGNVGDIVKKVGFYPTTIDCPSAIDADPTVRALWGLLADAQKRWGNGERPYGLAWGHRVGIGDDARWVASTFRSPRKGYSGKLVSSYDPSWSLNGFADEIMFKLAMESDDTGGTAAHVA